MAIDVERDAPAGVLTPLLPLPGEPEVVADVARWHAVADGVAEELGRDAAERDARNAPPFTEVELLRRAGLVDLVVPVELGGEGASFSTAYDVVRRIARTDGSIAQLLGYHYVFQTRIHHDLETPQRDALLAESAAHGWLWASTGTPQDAELRLRPDGHGGFVVSGVKTFATGSRVADRIVGFTTDERTEELTAIVIDATRPEVVRRDDWDVLGARLSASNGLELRDYRVAPGDVLGTLGRLDALADLPPHRTLSVPSFQLLFSHLYLGAAEGALLAARSYTRERSRPWFHADVESATEDPYVLATYGELVSRTQAVALLVRRAEAALAWAYERGPALTRRQRGEVAALIASAKVESTRAGLDVGARVFDVTGARATDRRLGLDLPWRNVRTHSLHDPVAYKLNEVGRFFLNDTLAGASPYR